MNPIEENGVGSTYCRDSVRCRRNLPRLAAEIWGRVDSEKDKVRRSEVIESEEVVDGTLM